jgi:Flp pilus assembly protein protease CpaA
VKGNDVAKYALLVAGGWAVSGAIGSAASSGPHPILKGALYSGVIGGVVALLHVALVEDPNSTRQVGTSGAPGRLPVRFP